MGEVYKRSLFSDTRFPKVKFGEDGWIAPEIFGKCSTIACISDIGYYYVQNPNSLIHNRNCMSYLCETEARFEQINYFRDHGMFRCAGHAYWEAAIKLQHAFARSRDGSLALPSELTDVLRTFRRYFWCHKYCTPKEQIQLAIIYINPNLYHFLFQNSIRYGIKAAYKSFFSKHTTT